MTAILEVLQSIAVALFGGSISIDGTAQEITGAIPTFWEWITLPEVIPFFLIGV